MTEQPKTLVILSPGFPTDEADSACIPPLQIFVRNLKQQFPSVPIIVLTFEYPFVVSQYQWNNVTVISFAGANKGGSVRLNTWRRVWLTLRRLNKQHRLLGLLSFWMGDCAFIADTFAKRKMLKHFSWIQGQDAKPGNKYFRWTKPKAESLIAISDFISAKVNYNYSIKPGYVIPIGIDPALFGQSPEIKDIDILSAGSLIPLKRYSLLIDMISTLRVYFPGIKAVICGDGPERDLLNNMIKEYHLEKNIELKGELPHTSVLSLMQRAKVFVHPSSYEGLSMVCIEALHAGAHVISFVRTIDTPVNNWHFAKSPDDMVGIIKKQLSDPSLTQTEISPLLIKDTCEAIMKLFDHNDPAIS